MLRHAGQQAIDQRLLAQQTSHITPGSLLLQNFTHGVGAAMFLLFRQWQRK